MQYCFVSTLCHHTNDRLVIRLWVICGFRSQVFPTLPFAAHKSYCGLSPEQSKVFLPDQFISRMHHRYLTVMLRGMVIQLYFRRPNGFLIFVKRTMILVEIIVYTDTTPTLSTKLYSYFVSYQEQLILLLKILYHLFCK